MIHFSQKTTDSLLIVKALMTLSQKQNKNSLHIQGAI